MNSPEAVRERVHAAQAVGLPLVFAQRLRGETPEEVRADAEAFARSLGYPAPAEVRRMLRRPQTS